ncbi:F-box/FBD/LRR-repeat protein At1g16930-like isoform X2 [Fagus crenata]
MAMAAAIAEKEKMVNILLQANYIPISNYKDLEGIIALGMCTNGERNLTDSTVLRNMSVVLAHSILACRSTLQGIAKLQGVSEDCISELPDQILVSVLSHLTVREALATSVLSRRWKYLWAYSTRLDFDSKNALGKLIINQSTERPRYVEWVDGFVECVDHVLGEYEVPTLDKFKISFDLDQRSTESINSWVEFAMTRPVQRLEMDLLGIRPYHYFQNLYYKQSCGCSPKQFSLNLPRICPPTSLGFKFLKDFYLKNVSITTEVLEYFLANCPNLERLSVFGSRHLVKLRVSGSYPSLKHLEFDEEVGLFPQLKNLKKLVVEVRAQNFDELLELTPLIIACPYLQILVLKNAVALEKILIDPYDQIVKNSAFQTANINQEQIARSRAKCQLEDKVPPSIELVIL